MIHLSTFLNLQKNQIIVGVFYLIIIRLLDREDNDFLGRELFLPSESLPPLSSSINKILRKINRRFRIGVRKRG